MNFFHARKTFTQKTRKNERRCSRLSTQWWSFWSVSLTFDGLNRVFIPSTIIESCLIVSMSKESSTRNPLHTTDVESGRSTRSSSIHKVVNLGVLPTPIAKPDTKPFAVSPSVAIVVFIVFVGDSSRGILFPALWPLCSSLGGMLVDISCVSLSLTPIYPLSNLGTLVDMGYLVAMFSVGRLVAATPFGYYCDRVRHKVTMHFVIHPVTHSKIPSLNLSVKPFSMVLVDNPCTPTQCH